MIDCFGILSDATIRRYFELGCEVKGLGRGHVKRLKDELRPKPSRRCSAAVRWRGSCAAVGRPRARGVFRRSG